MEFVPPRSETSVAHVYVSFSQLWYREKVRYACMYLVLWLLSNTDQAKAVRKLTQHLSETTSEDSEQAVGETTVNPWASLFPFPVSPSRFVFFLWPQRGLSGGVHTFSLPTFWFKTCFEWKCWQWKTLSRLASYIISCRPDWLSSSLLSLV